MTVEAVAVIVLLEHTDALPDSMEVVEVDPEEEAVVTWMLELDFEEVEADPEAVLVVELLDIECEELEVGSNEGLVIETLLFDHEALVIGLDGKQGPL